MFLFSNNARTTLADALTDDSGDPDYGTITAVADDSADTFQSSFGGNSQLGTLSHPSMPGVWEVVKILARSGPVFTVERGFELPTDVAVQAWPAGSVLEARVTAATLRSAPQSHDGFLSLGDSNPEIASYQLRALKTPVGVVRAFPLMLDAPLDGATATASALAVVGTSHFLDLGVPQTWAFGSYQHGDVVIPTTPNGVQYFACTNNQASYSVPSEPAFVDATSCPPLNADVPAPGFWIPTAMPIDIEMAASGAGFFVVEEVGFICAEKTSSTAPVVSIGSDLNGSSPDATRYADNVALSQITGDGFIHRIPVADGGQLVNALKFKVETAATGGVFRGRFYWRGFFVE